MAELRGGGHLHSCANSLSPLSLCSSTVVSKMLIESSNLIGQVPADIIQSAQMLANEMADCPKDSSCNGVPGEGGSGEETTGRYQKWRKRTGSLSGKSKLARNPIRGCPARNTFAWHTHTHMHMHTHKYPAATLFFSFFSSNTHTQVW